MKNPKDVNGTKYWNNEKGQLHRIDGPAVIRKDGSEDWYQNGKRHRTDGPAIIWGDGKEFWYINDKRIKPLPNIICLLKKKLEENALTTL